MGKLEKVAFELGLHPYMGSVRIARSFTALIERNVDGTSIISLTISRHLEGGFVTRLINERGRQDLSPFAFRAAIAIPKPVLGGEDLCIVGQNEWQDRKPKADLQAT